MIRILPAGTAAVDNGQYPSGVIDWHEGDWQIGTPYGKFGTFTLAFDGPESASGAEFASSDSPRIFAGLDVYNDGDSDATVTVRSPEVREMAFTIKPRELRRLRTGWRDPSSSVSFDITNGEKLRFDNLAYVHRDFHEDLQARATSVREPLD